MPDKEAFGPNMKWYEEARDKRSAAAKKAAATRARKKAERANWGLKPMRHYSYYQGSRTARLAVCSVSRLALVTAMRG